MKRNLNEYLQKCLEMCDKCNIPYGKIDSIVEDKAKNRWGQCRRRNGKRIIGISYLLIDSTYSEYAVASILGKSEDFDGLICELEDYVCML